MIRFNQPKNVRVQNNTLRYYRQGNGEVMLFVHGITTYSFIWRNIVPYFVDKYDVVVLDLLGCGESDKPMHEDFSLKRQANLLKDFCNEIGIDKFHMVCHDVGGGIGQIFSVNYPELLYDLILINTVAYNFWPVQPIIAMRTPIIRQIAMASLDFGMFEIIVKRGLYHKTKLTDELMEHFFKPMKSAIGRKGFLRFAKCLDNNNLTEIRQQLKTLSLPVLIIRGDADVYLTKSTSQHLHSEIPNSQLVVIETAGHYIQEDEPEMVAKTILNFISI